MIEFEGTAQDAVLAGARLLTDDAENRTRLEVLKTRRVLVTAYAILAVADGLHDIAKAIREHRS
jgi:hypothetical protein